ncbi:MULTISPECIES: Gfo/Idh/MocA family protein [Actinoalloteichus]|uniref:Dehydrogenase n=1 Tax=Actinoalloteichus fjordicus TaxID=1612552 RepID=A0AAC9LHI2_9PSEU|nr:MULTISPECIES: Gfo/Idh/MocA family oxidoreductase [Actinoalloteichus]APU16450.1 putative dehydrogenase [Actinoalloteichus fjordicus]APU22509.1 putative dehydrogenase [Actinoalloteichus sp. GBA129-24]
MVFRSAGPPLRIGVVGNGNRGIIAKTAAELDGDARVVAACDPLPTAHARAKERFGPDVLTTSSLSELIATGLDAAFVTSPDHLHADQACALLEAGVAVFVDKPMATTLEDCDRMLATARRTGSRLYVGHNMRHMPVIRLMRDLVVDGRIGEVKAIWCRYFVGDGGDRFFKDWHADRSKVNSLLLQKGAHDIDVIHWLAGGYTRRVSAMGGLSVYGGITDRRDRTGELITDWIDRKNNWPPLAQTGLNPVVDVEDVSMMTMALDNGVYATYSECHFTPDYWRNYTVIGTEGRIENFGLGHEGVVRLWNRRTEFDAEGHEEFPIPEAEGGHHGADPALLREFLAFVRTGVPTDTSPVAAREAVAAGALATESMRTTGSALDVPPLDPELVRYFEEGQR